MFYFKFGVGDFVMISEKINDSLYILFVRSKWIFLKRCHLHKGNPLCVTFNITL